jgi:hypothetical protein
MATMVISGKTGQIAHTWIMIMIMKIHSIYRDNPMRLIPFFIDYLENMN